MRGRRREVLVILTAFLMGATAPPALSSDRVGMTVELGWSVAEATEPDGDGAKSSSPAVMLELTDGEVIEAVAWPPPADPSAAGASAPVRTETGAWRLGKGPSGRLRMRIESGLGGEIVVSRGESAVRTPIVNVLDQVHGAPAPSSLVVTIERLPWDSLMVDFGPGAEDGTTAPGAVVPVTIGYNILQPDAAEVVVRTTVALRPIGRSEPVWRSEQHEAVAANRHNPSSRVWSIPAPEKEGTYVLEVQAVWEAVGARDGSRLGWLIRRRRSVPGSGAATRRVALAVFDSQARSPAASLAGDESPPRETEVDSFDMTRPRSARFSTWGRAPAPSSGSSWEVPREVLVEAARREKEREWLRGFIAKAGAEPARLKAADASGLAWSAVALRAARPEKPHRLSLTIADGSSSALGVAMIDPGGGGRGPRLVLDACASASPPTEPNAVRRFEWIVWPGAAEPMLVLLNRDSSADVTIGTVKLVELEPTPPSAEPSPDEEPSSKARGVGLHLAGPNALDRFGGAREPGLSDALGIAENLAAYLETCGGSIVVLPDHLADRHRRRAFSGRLYEDSTGPDRLDMALRVLRRHGKSAWLELDLEGENALPGLPPPSSAEALQQGLARVGRLGVGDDGMTYNPLHPKTREAMKRRVVEALTREADAPGFSGILIRLGRGPTLLGAPDTGIDDDTFARFVQETLGREAAQDVPGRGTADPDRFSARSKYLAGVGRMPWLAWRAKAIAGLYAELADAARNASPGAVLAVATPTLEAGPAGTEARRVDLAGLAPSLAWRSVGLDLELWETGPDAPVVLRAAELAADALARDLATHADLDEKVAAFSDRGFLLNAEGELASGAKPAGGGEGSRTDRRLVLSALPLGDGDSADELPAHALAGLDARLVLLSATTAAGFEDRLRRFGEILRLLPPDEGPARPPVGHGSGVVVRSLADDGRTVLQLVNDTPYPIRVAGVLKGVDAANVDDLGRKLRLAPRTVEGGRQLVVDLAPFAVSAIRVDAAGVQLDDATPYPSEEVLAAMEAQYRELSIQLGRLNRGLTGGSADALSEGFEPREARLASTATAEADEAAPAGWRLAEPAGADALLTVDADRPHAGTRSLKLESAKAPVSVVSGDFAPVDGASLLVQAHLRGDRDHAVVRLWIEGESGGKPYARRSEMVVTPDWRPLAVRVTDPPAEGLDSVRLRFEKTTPGAIWLDDVRVVGEAPPKAVRLNAQRAMLAALQAHRERRYADFARLADSHWAKHPGVAAMIRPGRPAELSASRPHASPDDPDDPSSSALSRNRALR